jgi:hypothetical protein
MHTPLRRCFKIRGIYYGCDHGILRRSKRAPMTSVQPPLTQDQWISEINKMRTAFGAPLPADQVETLAKYLYRINGARATRVHGASATLITGSGSCPAAKRPAAKPRQ